MKLLDTIAQSSQWKSNANSSRPFRDPHEYAKDLHSCPLRLTFADDFTRCSTALAYSEGDRLSACLDLIHIPNGKVWVEWRETPRLDTLSAMLDKRIERSEPEVRSGALISTNESGRSGSIRSFWCVPGDRAHCASMIVEFDLDLAIRRWTSVADVFKGASAALMVSEDPAFDALLNHMRFRFDPAWLKYYGPKYVSESDQAAVLCTALGSIAFIVPMLFAAFLLLGATGGTRQRRIHGRPLAQVRDTVGDGETLSHVEVSAALLEQWPDGVGEREDIPWDARPRDARELLEARGHLTRSGRQILWHSPDLQGNCGLGVGLPRTVKLSIA